MRGRERERERERKRDRQTDRHATPGLIRCPARSHSLPRAVSFAATRDFVFVGRSGDFLHASFVATRILTIPLRVLHLGGDFPGLAARVVLVRVIRNFLLTTLLATPARHELVLIHVIFV